MHQNSCKCKELSCTGGATLEALCRAHSPRTRGPCSTHWRLTQSCMEPEYGCGSTGVDACGGRGVHTTGTGGRKRNAAHALHEARSRCTVECRWVPPTTMTCQSDLSGASNARSTHLGRKSEEAGTRLLRKQTPSLTLRCCAGAELAVSECCECSGVRMCASRSCDLTRVRPSDLTWAWVPD